MTKPMTSDSEALTHADLVAKAANWLDSKCNVVLPEFFTHNAELPDVIGFSSRAESHMIECKASRADYLRDKKKTFRMWSEKGMGDYRYYCCPKDLIKEDEIPDGWGLIYVYPSGHTRRVVHALRLNKNIEAEHYLLYYYARRAVFAGVHSSVLAYRGYDQ